MIYSYVKSLEGFVSLFRCCRHKIKIEMKVLIDDSPFDDDCYDRVTDRISTISTIRFLFFVALYKNPYRINVTKLIPTFGYLNTRRTNQ